MGRYLEQCDKCKLEECDHNCPAYIELTKFRDEIAGVNKKAQEFLDELRLRNDTEEFHNSEG